MTLALLDTWRALLRQAANAETDMVRVAALAEAERVAAAIETLAPDGGEIAEAKLEVVLWHAARAFEGLEPHMPGRSRLVAI